MLRGCPIRPHEMFVIVLGILLMAIFWYDVIALHYFGPCWTISETVYATCRQYPVIPFLVGLLTGHLLWPQQ